MICDDKRDARITHIREHLGAGLGDIDPLIDNLRNKFNVGNSLLLLASYAEANAMLAWFSDRYIDEFLEWIFASAQFELDAVLLRSAPRPPYPFFIGMRSPLLSNDIALVQRYLEYFETRYALRRRNDVRADEYLVEQLALAISGEWEHLAVSCERWLGQEKLSQRQVRDVLDYSFLQALSARDRDRMEQALRSMVEPGELRKNAKFESGFTEDLISSKALIYAKVAWLHGINVDIESKFVPVDFLEWDHPASSAIYDSIVR
jgi:hypothetical protein